MTGARVRGRGAEDGGCRGVREGLEAGTDGREGFGVVEAVTRRRVWVVREDRVVRCSGRGLGVMNAMTGGGNGLGKSDVAGMLRQSADVQDWGERRGGTGGVK